MLAACRAAVKARLWADCRLPPTFQPLLLSQQQIGLDIVNEGEFTKGGDWLSYIDGRLSGFEVAGRFRPTADRARGAIVRSSGDFYKYAAERGTLFYVTQKAPPVRRNNWVCAPGPIAYAGQATLQEELDLYRQSITGNDLEDYFPTTTAPASLEPYHTNAYYKTTEEFVFALAEAMRTEYEMIANAGFIVQVDDARLAALTGSHRRANGARCISQILLASCRGAQSRASQYSGGSYPLSFALGQLARAACLRSSTARHCRSPAGG